MTKKSPFPCSDSLCSAVTKRPFHNITMLNIAKGENSTSLCKTKCKNTALYRPFATKV